MEPEILSFFITKNGDSTPILFYPSNTPVKIDIHIMLNNLTLAKHELSYKLTDGAGVTLEDFKQEVDFTDKASKNVHHSVAEIVVFAIFDDEDPLPKKYVKVDVTLDESVSTQTKFFIHEVSDRV